MNLLNRAELLHGPLAAEPRSERRALLRSPARFAQKLPTEVATAARTPSNRGGGRRGADVSRRASIPPSSTAGAPRQLSAHGVFRPADDASNGKPHGPRSGSERGPKYGRGSGHAPVIGRYSDRPSGGIWALASDSEFALWRHGVRSRRLRDCSHCVGHICVFGSLAAGPARDAKFNPAGALPYE